MENYYSYLEALNIISKHLSEIDNLSEFCLLNKLNYKVVLNIKNKKGTKQFPNTIQTLLNIFKYDSTIHKTIFIIKNKENGNNEKS